MLRWKRLSIRNKICEDIVNISTNNFLMSSGKNWVFPNLLHVDRYNHYEDDLIKMKESGNTYSFANRLSSAFPHHRSCSFTSRSSVRSHVKSVPVPPVTFTSEHSPIALARCSPFFLATIYRSERNNTRLLLTVSIFLWGLVWSKTYFFLLSSESNTCVVGVIKTLSEFAD